MSEAIQTSVLQINGVKSPLTVVLKHFAFAKQRFDSTADPAAKVALMLLPLATLLAYLVTDERLKKVETERLGRLSS